MSEYIIIQYEGNQYTGGLYTYATNEDGEFFKSIEECEAQIYEWRLIEKDSYDFNVRRNNNQDCFDKRETYIIKEVITVKEYPPL